MNKFGFDKDLTLTKVVKIKEEKFLFWKKKKVYHYWIVATPFSFRIKHDEFQGVVINVHAGFRTDLASVPRMFRGFFSVDGPWAQPAVLHDFLYSKRGVCVASGINFSREQCDNTFLEAMWSVGVPLKDRRLIYRGVRLGGWVPFMKSTDPKKEDEKTLDVD